MALNRMRTLPPGLHAADADVINNLNEQLVVALQVVVGVIVVVVVVVVEVIVVVVGVDCGGCWDYCGGC